ncbi:MAG: pantetheine-phosphate adenylyltransferase [Bacteroidaceae bacterium]|jgi:pantetheine-phosphate adenylyltransferase|nr:pantetheine-phosphate adenylyltransferase [Bacteroidaceae bacterium]MBQ2166233.1 pantetheine-phosphate adenylyltransferase [Bacteroidaceae bacterium]MBQ2181094.1 pantetheine-phosphate adenylyltransferase [Bacteroidaceae bacterium]MBQ2198935.1 pantetheine-phosphate adenylyltransferase [Bacteroidaceae bacterium]MBQ2586265.1 pantetheine-phosphate adenylyltransferase [Bacteroidaceae bacterium]
MKCLFPGSFDPFTLGHKSIVDRTLQFAEEVVIAIGVNAGKKSMFSLEERMAQIQKVYADEPRVKVASYEGLTTDFAESIGATAMVRGVRTAQDFEFERMLADVNRKLTGIETILLITEPQYSAISSSVVRELLSYGKDVKDFLP